MSRPYYVDDSVTLWHGDCLDVMGGMGDASVDVVVTDPPYELTSGKHGGSGVASVNLDSPYGRARIGTGNGGGFMGHGWDATGVAFDPATWRLVYRLMKPGAHLLAFGGTRTSHRLTCAIEDAGFEIRDSIVWLYGSGFPKSRDIGKAIDRMAGAEREVVGKYVVPADSDAGNAGKVIRSVTAESMFGITAGREGTDITAPATDDARRWHGWGTALKPGHEPIVVARKPLQGTVAGNVLAYGTGGINIDAGRVDMGGEYDPTRMQRQAAPTAGMSGLGESGFAADHEQATYNPAGRWPPNVALDEAAAAELDRQSGTLVDRNGGRGGWREEYVGATRAADTDTAIYRGEGGASRFFYVAKAAAHERPRDHDGTGHPTVKPLALIRWLVRLFTPPGGLILDPFAGSGTTGEAAVIEGFRAVLIEQDEASCRRTVRRITKPIQPVLDGAP